MTAGRNSPVNGTAAGTKKAQTITEKGRLEKSMADMKHSLEEMSMTSVCEGMDTVSSTQGDELKLEKGGIAVGSNQMVIVKQDFQTQNLQKNKLQNSEKLSEREHGVMPIHHPQKLSLIHI